ncbi:MAG: DUF4450 domain-containing protein [Tepidisphaeraceae bacterium]
MTRLMKSLCGVVGVFTSIASAGLTDGPNLDRLQTPIYAIDGDALVRHNGDRFNNRPLYGSQVTFAVLTGDRPLVRFGTGSMHNGTFMLAIVRGDTTAWLHDFADIAARFKPGHTEWIARDERFAGLTIHLDAVPADTGTAGAVRLRADGAREGDRVVWAYGGGQRSSFMQGWDVTTQGRDEVMTRKFVPNQCDDDTDRVENDWFVVTSPATKGSSNSAIRCETPGPIAIGDADTWTDPAALLKSKASRRPVGVGSASLSSDRGIHWSIVVAPPEQLAERMKAAPKPSEVFDAGLKRVESVSARVVVDTPDPALNIAVAAAGHALDGIYRNGMYTHSGMRWSVPLIGWRSMYGPIAFGWHDRVLTEAQYCISKQITESDKTRPVADPAKKLASQAPESRLFGKGRIAVYHGNHYDMQSLFFDQLIEEWRATADPELEKILRPALELHLNYIQECFDPDNDGLYESYANTWPTDAQWYSGGATAEETAYAYNGHRAAMDMAKRGGDEAAVARHRDRLDQIDKAFRSKLWLADAGHAAAYIEQTGLKRAHASCWLYTIFCPIEAGLVSEEDAVASLCHTEVELQRVKMPYGGEQCWPSNWVPAIWSVRQMWPGDNYALAQAYFQTGLAEEGWELLRGTFPENLQYGPVPGDLGYPAGGTDFSDCASPFARAVVRGLFGYKPDYPNNRVTIAPQFPYEWDHASLRTPDVSIAFKRAGDVDRYEVKLTKPAPLSIAVPVDADDADVMCNIADQQFPVINHPMFNGPGATIALPATSDTVVIRVMPKHRRPRATPIEIDAEVNSPVTIRSEVGPIVRVVDPQSVLATPKFDAGQVVATVRKTPGDCTLVATVRRGERELNQLIHIRTHDSAAEVELKRVSLLDAPAAATWKPIDLAAALNGDLRTIYQQQYLSPRPNTVSLRLASDGYSTWPMVLDEKITLPVIKLNGVAALTGTDKLLVAPNGAKFAPPSEIGNNIAFTSQWDNWPRSRTVDVNARGEGIFFLLAGTTNPMQVRIANATLRLTYADGVEESIDLVPPFNFWTLCPINKIDYNLKRDGFAIGTPPPLVQLGDNCRATIVGRRLRPGVTLKSVTLDAKSPEVVIGLMGVSIMNPAQ